ncbi:MAG: YifB family Mg chelatase-like AAA ATPase [Oscillospiraceae bacterium]
MFARVCSMGVYALEGFAVNVEADISGGLPQFAIVGLPDNAVKEATDRVRSALKNLNYTYPVSRITINLAPADIKKTGPVYDLPVLLAILAASGQIKDLPDDTAFVGELSLDGSIRGVNGILPMTIAAQKCGKKAIFVPSNNALEASAVEGIKIYAVENAKQVVLHLLGENVLPEVPALEFNTQTVDEILEFADVRGQLEAKRALEIAAAGGHNLLMVGSPGSGKSMLAKRLPGILPPLTREEAMETTKIYSVAGNMKNGVGLITQRPFRAPHHSVSATGLSGGGATPRPGEISLAHNGVLFLDELPEFHRDALEILRQPVEDGIVTVSRVAGTATFPCQIMLIAAMNPCPCGYFGHPTRACTCNQSSIDRYLQRISGPLLDRIDLHVEVLPVDYEDIASEESGECSADIAVRVAAARAVQLKRFAGTNVACNAQIPSAMLRRICRLSKDANKLLKLAFERMGLSARAYDRVLKVSRTIADLDGSDIIDTQHVSEAVQYRNMDRKYWYTR